jgi:hypothetical protein
MATDILVLGSIVFDNWSTPERMPFGGEQQLAVTSFQAALALVDLGPARKRYHVRRPNV